MGGLGDAENLGETAVCQIHPGKRGKRKRTVSMDIEGLSCPTLHSSQIEVNHKGGTARCHEKGVCEASGTFFVRGGPRGAQVELFLSLQFQILG